MRGFLPVILSLASIFAKVINASAFIDGRDGKAKCSCQDDDVNNVDKNIINGEMEDLTVPGTSGYKMVVYFPNWAIYGRRFEIFHMDWEKITHINYAFADVKADGSVTLTDPWADTDKRYLDRGDSWNDPPDYLFGCFGQAFKLKQKHRHVKMGLSIGGWTLSKYFSDAFASEAGRAKFVSSSLTLLVDLGLDFIDIDWEYPIQDGNEGTIHRPEDVDNFIEVLKEFRRQFIKLPFMPQLSVASPSGYAMYRHWKMRELCGLLDFVNVMTYDAAGAWSSVSDHQANLEKHPDSPNGYSVRQVITDYIKMGCPRHKIVLGAPIYGRSFDKTNGLFQTFSPPMSGTWEKGVFDYKFLPLPGSQEIFDPVAKASYSYDSNKKQLITYDNTQVLDLKIDFLQKNGLGGLMFWEASSDFPTSHPRSLIGRGYAKLKDSLDMSRNNLFYPGSKYGNVRSKP